MQRPLRPPPEHTAFSLAELLVVIGIIGVLLSLLLPALAAARQRAFASVCKSNLRSVGQSLFAYAGDNNGYFFDDSSDDFIVVSWLFSAVGEIGSGEAEVLLCPTGADNEVVSYIINNWTMNGHCRLGRVGQGLMSPSDALLLGENIAGSNMNRTESSPWNQPPPTADRDEQRHGEQLRSNHLYLDGHVDNRVMPPRTDHWDRWYIP